MPEDRQGPPFEGVLYSSAALASFLSALLILSSGWALELFTYFAATVLEFYALWVLAILLLRRLELRAVAWLVCLKMALLVVIPAHHVFIPVADGLLDRILDAFREANPALLIVVHAAMLVMAGMRRTGFLILFLVHCGLCIAGKCLLLTGSVDGVTAIKAYHAGNVALGILFVSAAWRFRMPKAPPGDRRAALLKEAASIRRQLERGGGAELERELTARYEDISRSIQTLGEGGAVSSDQPGAFAEPISPPRRTWLRDTLIYAGSVSALSALAGLFSTVYYWGFREIALVLTGPQHLILEALGFAKYPSAGALFVVSLFYFPVLFAPLGALGIGRRWPTPLVIFQFFALLIHVGLTIYTEL